MNRVGGVVSFRFIIVGYYRVWFYLWVIESYWNVLEGREEGRVLEEGDDMIRF